MKKSTLILSLIFNVTLANLFCQSNSDCLDNTQPSLPCCNGIISTDKNHPNDVERPDINLNNVFDWNHTDHFDVWNEQTGSADIIGNPFYIAQVNPDYSSLANNNYYNFSPGFDYNYLNMHPRYGWELMYSHFNVVPFTTTEANAIDKKNGYTVIFYNRYTGKMRMFTYPFGDAQWTSISNVISLDPPTSFNLTNQSAIFNHYNTRSKALDQSISTTKVQAMAPNGINYSTFLPAWMDYQLAYDPCVCLNNSIVSLKFHTQLQAVSNLYAEGHEVGISSPLEGSEHVVNLDPEYLMSVYGDFKDNSTFEVEHGFQIYDQVDQLIADNEAYGGLEWLSVFFETIGLIAEVIDPAIVFDKVILEEGVEFEHGVKLGTAISGSTGFLSGLISPPGQDIHFIQSQIALRGHVTTTYENSVFGDVILRHPGSKKAVGAPSWINYPIYNEAPGLFAILNTPFLFMGTLVYQPTNEPTIETTHRIAEMALKDEIKYALNPAAGIDLNKTKIYAAIEYDVYFPDPYFYADGFASLIDVYDTTFEVVDIQYIPGTSNSMTKVTLQTQPVPIDMIDDFKFRQNFNSYLAAFGDFDYVNTSYPYEIYPADPRLKITAVYTFLPNAYGEQHQSLQIYTYELDHSIIPVNKFYDCTANPSICSKTAFSTVWIPETLYVDATHFTANQTIQAEVVIIQGNLTADPGIQVYIYGSNAVVINDEIQINGPIIISDNDPFYDAVLNPQPAFEVNKFCTAGGYKANILRNSESAATTHTEEENMTAKMVVYPNPSNGNVNIMIEGWDGKESSMVIHDMSGRLVYSQIITNAENTTYYERLDLNSLASGAYFLTFRSNDLVKTEKLIIK
jgi:hypothetical protein